MANEKVKNNDDSNPRSKEGWRQWVQAYYVVNFLVLMSWAPLRLFLPGSEILQSQGAWFATKEREVFMLVGFGLLAKARRASSMYEYCFRIFLYGKVAIFLCLVRAENFVAMGLFLCLLSFLFVALPTPTFAGAELVEHFDNPSLFTETVLRQSQNKDDPIFIVMFTAEWCESCGHAMPLFCSLAAESTSRRRKFVAIDVGRFPNVGRRFKINLDFTTKQLPTFALFFQGSEYRRLPYFDQQDKVVKTKFSRESLHAFFLLNKPVKDAVIHLRRTAPPSLLDTLPEESSMD